MSEARITVPDYEAIPLPDRRHFGDAEMVERAERFLAEMKTRHSVRDFAPIPVPRAVIEACIATAGRAPSGANHQPWHFIAVGDPAVKRRIRVAAEAEEKAFYAGKAGEEWLSDLTPLGTDADKPFLEVAPWLIVVFAESWERGPGGRKHKNYYVAESVGIATGMLVTAVHQAGLVSLTHTPSPMGFLGRILGRPDNERPFLVLVVGFPDEGAEVPAIIKKPLEQIATFIP